MSRLCVDAILDAMAPGVTLNALVKIYTDLVEREAKGKYMWEHHGMVHGRGLGDERSTFSGANFLERYGEVPQKIGMSFVLKPRIQAPWAFHGMAIGDSVVITENGARRLGRRELVLQVID